VAGSARCNSRCSYSGAEGGSGIGSSVTNTQSKTQRVGLRRDGEERKEDEEGGCLHWKVQRLTPHENSSDKMPPGHPAQGPHGPSQGSRKPTVPRYLTRRSNTASPKSTPSQEGGPDATTTLRAGPQTRNWRPHRGCWERKPLQRQTLALTCTLSSALFQHLFCGPDRIRIRKWHGYARCNRRSKKP
jgi:hypothetical protein